MTSGGETLEPLWLVGSPIDPLAHFDGDHGVLLTMQHENGRFHETDISLVVISISNDQFQRQPKIKAARHLDR